MKREFKVGMRLAIKRGGRRLSLLPMSLLSPFIIPTLKQLAYHTSPSVSRSAYSATAFNLRHQDITLQRCRNPYNNSRIIDFYRSNFHERRNKKVVPSFPKEQDDANDIDTVYTLRTCQDEIVGALRLTKSKNDEKYTFLRSMCVSREYRHHGLGTKLLNDSLREFNAHHCFCFASPDLDRFYNKLGFTSASDGNMNGMHTPKWMLNSFDSMANRNQHKQLKLFIKHHHVSLSSTNSSHSTEIVLLQHFSELSKKTATGWLLNDTQYSHHFGDIPINELVESRMKVTIWPWRGTNDIALVEDEIAQLKKTNRTVYLLWTGGAASQKVEAIEEDNNETYVIIDGTWQQALKIYRKIPALWSLPRISLTVDEPSKYILRGDYSGWRERFGTGGDGGDLLCTAEVAAAVMDRCGDGTCGDLIRSRLDVFQSSFPHAVGELDKRR